MAKKTYPHPHARRMIDRMECIGDALISAEMTCINLRTFVLSELPERHRQAAENLIANLERKLTLANRALRGEDEEKGQPHDRTL